MKEDKKIKKAKRWEVIPTQFTDRGLRETTLREPQGKRWPGGDLFPLVTDVIGAPYLQKSIAHRAWRIA